MAHRPAALEQPGGQVWVGNVSSGPREAVAGATWTTQRGSYGRSTGLPGLCVATADVHGPRFSAGFGHADVAAKQPYTPDTVQPVGSLSKTLIGLAIAYL